MKALMCPNCEAKIQADPGREYVFCTYCGDKILLRSLLDIQTEDEAQEKAMIQSKLENGDAFLQMNDYYRAELIYHELINDFPDCPSGYERMIRIYTRDYTVFRMENKERVFSCLEKAFEVAAKEQVAEYKQLKEKLEAVTWQEAEKREDALEMPKIDLVNAKKKGIFVFSICIAAFAFMEALYLKIISTHDQVKTMTNAMIFFFVVLGLVAACFAVYIKMKK